MTRTTSSSSLPSDNEGAVIVLATLNSSNSEPSSTSSPSSGSNIDDESSSGGPDFQNDELNNTVRLKPIIKRLYSSTSLSTHKKRPPRCVRFDKRRPQTMEVRDWRIGIEDIVDGPPSTSIFSDKNNGELNVGSETTREIQRASVVIGFIASVFFFLCITLVGMALYYTPELDKLANGKGYPTLNGSVFMMNVSTNLNYSPSLVDLNDENNILTDDSNKTNIN
ncbi:uncharacterized protein [Lepeophtheirus salmonis]